MNNISDIENCYGCGVCAAACPRNIIQIRLNKKGFYEPYILVYVLDYMYNPYPDIYNIVRKVKAELGCKVIYIGTNAVDSTDDAASYVGGILDLWNSCN